MVSGDCTAHQTAIAVGSGGSIGLAATAQDTSQAACLLMTCWCLVPQQGLTDRVAAQAAKKNWGLPCDKMQGLSWKNLHLNGQLLAGKFCREVEGRTNDNSCVVLFIRHRR